MVNGKIRIRIRVVRSDYKTSSQQIGLWASNATRLARIWDNEKYV